MYRLEEAQRIQDVLTAFKEYTEDSFLFDIIYSAKVGYLWLDIMPNGPECYQLRSAEELIQFFILDIYRSWVRQGLSEKRLKQGVRREFARWTKELPADYEILLELFLKAPYQENIRRTKRLVLR